MIPIIFCLVEKNLLVPVVQRLDGVILSTNTTKTYWVMQLIMLSTLNLNNWGQVKKKSINAKLHCISLKQNNKTIEKGPERDKFLLSTNEYRA